MIVNSENYAEIKKNDIVTVIKAGHIIDITYSEKQNQKARIKKLNKDEYLHCGTGEIKQFEHQSNRDGNIAEVRESVKNLRHLINNNFAGKPNELFITLTYKENMTDTKRLYEDSKKYMMKLRYEYKDISNIDYISVVEPQLRGAWHIHQLVRFNDISNIFIENGKLAEIWGNGFVTVKSLKQVDNIGAYLSAYLTNIKNGETKKGAKLYLYPTGLNIYRCSRGIQKPQKQKKRFDEIEKEVGSTIPNFQRQVTIQSNDYTNTIHYIQYNLKRQE